MNTASTCRPRPALALLAGLALSGCSVDADYTLTLVPRTLPSQDIFGGDIVAKAVLRAPDGSLELAALDEGLRPLADEYVGIAVEEAGGAPDEFNRFLLTAYGEIGPLSLSTGERTESREVFVPAFGVVGDMDSLPAAHHEAAAAMLPKGGVVVVGGGDVATGDTDDGIYWLEHPDTEEWRLQRVADLPAPRAGASADVVEIDGVHRVFVAGGRRAIGDLASNGAQALIFDPLFERIGWYGELAVARSEHASVVLEDGKVLLVGGWTEDGQAPDNATFEIFDPVTRTLTPGSSALDVPSVGLAAVSLGTDGALVCGGGVLTGNSFTPVATCNQISLTGAVSEAAPMLGPRMGHALVRMHDEAVLLSGGVDREVSRGTPAQGITTASLYVPREDSWDQIGPMELRRVGHELLALGDGRYLAVGGGDATDFFGGWGAARNCTELFDPASFQWDVREPCGATGRGGGFAVAARPEHGAFVLTGYDPDAASGGAYGWIGFGPPVLPGDE